MRAGVSMTALAVLLLCACGTELPNYASCKSSDECADGMSCFQVTLTDTGGAGSAMRYREGNACTRRCGADADCPGEGACYALDGDPSATYICFERCLDDTYCWEGFQCLRTLVRDPATGASMEGAGICVPLPVEG